MRILHSYSEREFLYQYKKSSQYVILSYVEQKHKPDNNAQNVSTKNTHNTKATL